MFLWFDLDVAVFLLDAGLDLRFLSVEVSRIEVVLDSRDGVELRDAVGDSALLRSEACVSARELCERLSAENWASVSTAMPVQECERTYGDCRSWAFFASMLVNWSTERSVKSRSFPAVLFRTKGVLIRSPLIARAADLASAKLRGGALVVAGGAAGRSSEEVDVDGIEGTVSRGAGRGKYSPWEFIAASVARVSRPIVVLWQCRRGPAPR